MRACPALLAHPDLGVRPPGEPLPAPLARHTGALAQVFQRWLRQRDDAGHAAEKRALTLALAAVPDEAVWRASQRQAAIAASAGWDHWVWAVPVATVAALLGLVMDTVDEQRQLLMRLRALAAGLAGDASLDAVAAADGAVQALLDAAEAADGHEAAAQAPLQQALRDHADAREWPDRTSFAANRLALLWQSHEAGAALLGHGLLALGRTGAAPDAAALLAIARDGGAVRLTRRFALRDTLVGDASLTAGQPLTVDLAGSDHPFGGGPHECPGRSLALTTAVTALAWAAEQPDLPRRVQAPPLRLPNLDVPRFSPAPEETTP